jgi:hypothetical protein
VATTSSATNVTTTSATLRGSVNPNGERTTAYFEYGLTAGYGSVSGSVNNQISSVPVSIVVSNLLNGTNYHFRMVANNSHGTRTGSDAIFTTLSGIPTVTTLDPTDGGATSMRLNGSVIPNGANATAWFEVGTTTNYGSIPVAQNVGDGTTQTNFDQMIVGLAPGTTYRYRAVAVTSFGTNYGADVLFTPVFSDIGLNITNSWGGSIVWADYDNDERLDFLLTGLNSAAFVPPVAQLWRNTTNGFVLASNAVFTPLRFGSAAWGDYDNNGVLELLLTGSTDTTAAGAVTKLYRNDFGDTFSEVSTALPGVFRSSAAWGDYDDDGRLDVLLTGLNTNTNAIAQVWRNTSTGFVLGATLSVPGFARSSVAWGDYNNDGRLDILIAGIAQGLGSRTRIFRNNGFGNFTELGFGLPGVSGFQDSDGAVAWGDYDNDGRLDILLSGTTNGHPSGAVAQVWRNTTNGFALNTNVTLTSVVDGSVAWGDYDNDGRLDILLTGFDANWNYVAAQVWRNTGNGSFVNINAGLPPSGSSSAGWGDYDNDGRLDILMTSFWPSGPRGVLWRNNFPASNSPPAAPSGLTMTVSNTALTLAWAASADSETPGANLTYNVRIGTASGMSTNYNVFSPSSDATGFRRLPQPGNAGHRLMATLNNYVLGTTYYWSVQAVDGGFGGSPFAPDSSFKLLPVAVPPASTRIVPGDLNGDGIVDQSEFAAVLTNLNGNGIVSQAELDMVLSNYWPYSPWLYMTNVAGLGGTTVTFALTNSIAGAFGVEYTTNFMDWFFLGPATPRYLFTDTNAPTQPQRHYRLRWP